MAPGQVGRSGAFRGRQKGAIAAGSDADIAILDPGIRKTLRKEDLHESDYSPWEGWEIAGWPTTTIQHGRVVVEDGQLARCWYAPLEEKAVRAA